MSRSAARERDRAAAAAAAAEEAQDMIEDVEVEGEGEVEVDADPNMDEPQFEEIEKLQENVSRQQQTEQSRAEMNSHLFNRACKQQASTQICSL